MLQINLQNLLAHQQQLRLLAYSSKVTKARQVPGYLIRAIYQMLNYGFGSKNALNALILYDSKLICFLENLMLGVFAKVEKANPKVEYSFVYYNISETVKSVLQQYPLLDSKILPRIFRETALTFFDQSIRPYVNREYDLETSKLMFGRYTQLILHFEEIMNQKIQSDDKLKKMIYPDLTKV